MATNPYLSPQTKSPQTKSPQTKSPQIESPHTEPNPYLTAALSNTDTAQKMQNLAQLLSGKSYQDSAEEEPAAMLTPRPVPPGTHQGQGGYQSALETAAIAPDTLPEAAQNINTHPVEARDTPSDSGYLSATDTKTPFNHSSRTSGSNYASVADSSAFTAPAEPQHQPLRPPSLGSQSLSSTSLGSTSLGSTSLGSTSSSSQSSNSQSSNSQSSNSHTTAKQPNQQYCSPQETWQAEKVRQQQAQAAEAQAATQRRYLERQAQQFLRNLEQSDVLEGDRMWFEAFAELCPSRLEAAIEFIQTIDPTASRSVN